jgi:plasmid stabilization system protein ParE
MRSRWTDEAISDVVRLYEFLAPVNPRAAARVVQSLTAAPRRLETYPRLGERLEQFDPREVRRILVGTYEMRYELRENTILIVRVWHTREQR